MNKINKALMSLDPGIAGKILIGICSLLIAFHVANYLGKIPVNVSWLGRIDSDSTLKFMSFVSVILNVIIIICALVKCKYIYSEKMNSLIDKVLPFVFWWLVGNSIANLFSKSKFEVVVFTPLLLILTVCVYVLKNTDGGAKVR